MEPDTRWLSRRDCCSFCLLPPSEACKVTSICDSVSVELAGIASGHQSEVKKQILYVILINYNNLKETLKKSEASLHTSAGFN